MLRYGNYLSVEREGEEINAYSGVLLDSLYKDIFRNAKRSIRRNRQDPESAIKGIVFGCFLVEAKCNSLLGKVMKDRVSPELFSITLWKSVRYANVVVKMELLVPFASNRLKERAEVLFPTIRRAFDLRNRLAHFKGEKNFIGPVAEPEDLLNLLKSNPLPSLLDELDMPKVDEHLSALTEADLWLSRLNRSLYKPLVPIVASDAEAV